MGVRETDPLSQLSLPPGFRFYPTDEELLMQYLCRKVAGQHLPLQIMEILICTNLTHGIFQGFVWRKRMVFFQPKRQKIPNGSRPNRVAGSGYWKATGTGKVIATEGRKVGIKKALVFYVGKAPKGTKTNWIMHEYRLSEPSRKHGSSRLDEWVLCRIYKKSSSGQKPTMSSMQSNDHSHASISSCSSQYDDVLESLPDIENRLFSLPRINSVKHFPQQEGQKTNLQHLNSGNFDWAALAGLTPLPEPVQAEQMNNNMKAEMTCIPCLSGDPRKISGRRSTKWDPKSKCEHVFDGLFEFS